MNKVDLLLEQGSTFQRVVRWETEPVVYKAITGITQAAPVRITATAHGIPDGWRVKVQSVKGMTDIVDGKWHAVTVVDVNSVELNDVNAAEFKAYVSGGYLLLNTPHDLASYTARMSIKDKIGGTELLRLDTTNNRILIDDTAKTITLVIDAVTTAGITWGKGVYDLELVSATGEVTAIMSGAVTVSKEVTTT